MTAETLGTHVLFSIADNGIGLSSEDMEQSAKPFWRALHQPLVRQHPGTGLRLYRAQQMLSPARQRTAVLRRAGHGQHFQLQLPVARSNSGVLGGNWRN